MTEAEIEAIILRELNIVSPDADRTLAYDAVPEWTSASHMNVIMAIEDELGVEFSPDDIVEMTDVAAIHGVIARRAVG